MAWPTLESRTAKEQNKVGMMQHTEWVLGSNRLCQLHWVTDSVLVGGRHAEQVLVLIMKICDMAAQFGGFADLLPRLPLDVLLLDHVMRDRAAAIVLRDLPLKID